LNRAGITALWRRRFQLLIITVFWIFGTTLETGSKAAVAQKVLIACISWTRKLLIPLPIISAVLLWWFKGVGGILKFRGIRGFCCFGFLGRGFCFEEFKV
jgi:hypothetical protein